MPDAPRETVNTGTTGSGTIARAGDGVERLRAILSLIGADQRIGYLPLVRPIRLSGVRCPVAAAGPQELRPEAFECLAGSVPGNAFRPGEGLGRPARVADQMAGAAPREAPARTPPLTG